MVMHMDYKCHSSDHIAWIMLAGVPTLIIWVIGMPILAFIALYKNRNDLECPMMKRYLLLLYQGLRPRVFYWEIVNTLRKLILVSINIFLNTYSPYYKILFSIGEYLPLISLVILVLFWRLQIRLQPYKDKENNKIEVMGILAGLITLYWALVFVVEGESLTTIYNLSLLFLFIVNIAFLLNWFYCLWLSFKFKNKWYKTLMKIFAIGLWKKVSKEDIKLSVNAE